MFYFITFSLYDFLMLLIIFHFIAFLIIFVFTLLFLPIVFSLLFCYFSRVLLLSFYRSWHHFFFSCSLILTHRNSPPFSLLLFNFFSPVVFSDHYSFLPLLLFFIHPRVLLLSFRYFPLIFRFLPLFTFLFHLFSPC